MSAHTASSSRLDGGRTDPTDLELLDRFAGRRDAAAFAQIVQRYAGCVYGTGLRVLGDGAAAEDVSQETFFRLMQRPREVKSNLGGWLHRTATHLALDALRSQSARRRREIAYTGQSEHEASSWAELSPCVDQALTEMPEELRTLLVQHFLMGRTQADLAEESGQSAATISRRIQEGLEELRGRLRMKGLYAAPAALAALLGEVWARQAPAGLMRELGKMTMLCGAGGAASPQASPHRIRSAWRRLGELRLVLFLAAAIAGAIVLYWLITTWAWPWSRPQPPEQQPLEQRSPS